MSMRDRDVSWARFAIMVSSVPLTPFVVSRSGTLVIGLISIETGVVWMNIDCVCVCVSASVRVCMCVWEGMFVCIREEVNLELECCFWRSLVTH